MYHLIARLSMFVDKINSQLKLVSQINNYCL